MVQVVYQKTVVNIIEGLCKVCQYIISLDNQLWMFCEYLHRHSETNGELVMHTYMD